MSHRSNQAFTARRDEFATSSSLPSGEAIRIRSLRTDDKRRLGAYLTGLSETTRSLWGPHPFDQATADQICAELQTEGIWRIVATLSGNGAEQIIAYTLVEPGSRQSDRDRYAALGIQL